MDVYEQMGHTPLHMHSLNTRKKKRTGGLAVGTGIL